MTNELINKIMDYEQGKLETLETLELFDELEETGLLYRLQGAYRRAYCALEREGLVGYGSELVRAVFKGGSLEDLGV
jgi:hypothetical protein